MGTKLRDIHLKVGQIWVRKRKVSGITYTIYFKLKTKNSNNMWLLEQILVVPVVPKADEYMFKKEEWWHKDRIIVFAELLASEADIAVLKVLYG